MTISTAQGLPHQGHSQQGLSRHALSHQAPQPRPATATFGPYELLQRPGTAGGTIVAFTSLGNPPDPYEAWEFSGQLDPLFPDWQVVFVRDQSRSWYNAEPEALEAALDAIARYMDDSPGAGRVLLGLSIGGFAALAFAGRLGARTCIALSPQTVAARDLTRGSDHRWDTFLQPHEPLPVRFAVPAADCRYHIVYPNRDIADAWQVAQFVAQDGFYYALDTSDHNCAVELKRRGLLGEFIRQAITAPDRPASIPGLSGGRPDFGGRTVKDMLALVRTGATGAQPFDAWADAAGIPEVLRSTLLQYWCHSRDDVLLEDDVRGLPDPDLLTIAKRFPSRPILERVAVRAPGITPDQVKAEKYWLADWRRWSAGDGSLAKILRTGWGSLETWGAWSIGSVSQLELPVRMLPGKSYRVRLTGNAPPGRKSVAIRVQGRVGLSTFVDEQAIFGRDDDVLFHVTAPPADAPVVSLAIEVARLTCPLLDHPVIWDTRTVGLGLRGVSIGLN